MTVRELIDVSPFCDLIQIVVRDNGKWVQGYRVGKDAHIYPSEIRKEVLEKNNLEIGRGGAWLEDGQEVDLDIQFNSHNPMKVICKDVMKTPDYIGNLKIQYIQPRHIPSLHGNALTHNDFSFDIDCYPDGYVPEQMSFGGIS